MKKLQKLKLALTAQPTTAFHNEMMKQILGGYGSSSEWTTTHTSNNNRIEIS